MMVGGIFSDIHKAFDCVHHNLLLTKLEFYGITGITYKLLKSYLKGRYQRERENDPVTDPVWPRGWVEV